MTLDGTMARHPGADTFTFGDGPELCAELNALVRSGAKTATCFAERELATAEEVMPVVGGRAISLGWDGRPALVIETASVDIWRFRDVPEDFALAEGEGTFEDWRRAHEAFFARNGGFDPGMMLVCERFRLEEDLGGRQEAERSIGGSGGGA